MNDSANDRQGLPCVNEHSAKAQGDRSSTFATYLRFVKDCVIVLSETGVVADASDSTCQLLKRTHADLIGKDFANFIVTPGPLDAVSGFIQTGVEFRAWLGEVVESLADPGFEFDETHVRFQFESDGKIAVMEGQAVCCRLETRIFCFVTLHNIQCQLDREATLKKKATTDFLTGILNRRGFQGELEVRIGSPMALAFFDVDYFKKINDTNGHETGDQTLAAIGKALSLQFNDDVVARLGGDEFAVLISSKSDSTQLDAEVVSRRISDVLDLVHRQLKMQSRSTTISVGVALDRKGSVTARDLLAAADAAMYQSKSEGRNRVTTDVLN